MRWRPDRVQLRLSVCQFLSFLCVAWVFFSPLGRFLLVVVVVVEIRYGLGIFLPFSSGSHALVALAVDRVIWAAATDAKEEKYQVK